MSDAASNDFGAAIERLKASVGFEIVERSGERVRATLEVGPDHHQPYGLVHGGLWTFLVESVASLGATDAVLGDGMVAVGINNDTDFLRPVVSGPVEVLATAVHQGRTQQLWQVDITRGDDGKLIARGRLRLQNVPRPG